MEGSHGQLGSRLTDRLGRYHADSFTHVDLMTAAQITPITGGTDTVAGLTGDGGAHHDLIDAQLFQTSGPYLVNHGTGFQDDLIRAGLDHVLGHNAAQYPVGQGFDDVTAVDDRGHQQAVIGTAVFLGHHHILGNIHQPAGEVTGVRRLQGGVREALTGTVGGDEVLQNVQPLTEVGHNRRLDD